MKNNNDTGSNMHTRTVWEWRARVGKAWTTSGLDLILVVWRNTTFCRPKTDKLGHILDKKWKKMYKCKAKSRLLNLKPGQCFLC